MIPAFDLLRPTTIAEALEMTAAGGTPYCGGTELLAAMKLGVLEPEVLVDLKALTELRGIAIEGGRVSIGGCTTHREVARSIRLADRAGALICATSQLGNMRVRAIGSIAGNLCFAEPRSDVVTALAALGASVELASLRGRREMPVEDFVVGAFTTERRDEEILTAVIVPEPIPRSHYVRFQPTEYPMVSMGLAVGESVRLVVGAVGERPQVLAFDRVEDIVPEAVAEQVQVTVDRQGTEDYKRHLVAVFVRRILGQAHGRGRG